MQASGCVLESKMAAVIGSFYREQFVLLDYLRRLDSNGCFSLVETTDPKDYLHILDKVTVAVPEGVVHSAISEKPTRRLCLKGLVFEVIQHVLCGKTTKENVLAFGFEAVVEHNKQGTVSGTPSIKNTHINSAFNCILSEPWKLLHERVGDEVMFQLLTRVALFLEMPSKCYLQISGKPITSTLQLTPEQLRVKHSTGVVSVGSRGNCKRKRCTSDGSENSATPTPKRRKTCQEPGKRVPDETNASWNEQLFPRSSVFHSSTFKQKLPLNHIFEIFNTSNAATRKVIKTIFLNSNKMTSGTKKRSDSLPRRLYSMIPLFLNIVKRHKKCRFRKLLRLHCPYKAPKTRIVKGKGTTAHHNNLIFQHAVKSFTSPHQVTRFLRCVCDKVIPLELWGCAENRKQFVENLERFVGLRKGETFSLAQMMNGIKVSKCQWLKSEGCVNKRTPLSESLKQKEILGQFVWWFVRRYLMVILKSFFYITESALHRNRVFYYRKPVWKIISNYGVQSLQGDVLEPLTKSAAKEMLAESPWGASTLRFLPKAQKVRPIIDLNRSHVTAVASGKQTGNLGKAVSINWKLNDAFKILTFERERNPTLLGSSLFGVDGIYRKLKPYIMNRKTKGDSRPLYIVHTDISDCYESIVQSKMCDIMKRALQEDEYYIRQFHVLSRTANGSKVTKVFQKHVSDMEDSDLWFTEFLEKEIAESKLWLNNTVVVDSVRHITKDKDHILELLKQHILCSVVKIGNQFFHKKRGIAQGSCVSSIFCSYYYGSMEKDHFQAISNDDDSLLLRWVDDFLVLTPHRELADQFLRTMHAGIPDYGCYVNSAKTLVNFDAVNPDGTSVRRVRQDEKFPWCGFLFDQQTLEAQCDYSRYDGCSVNDTITTELHKNPGQALKSKLQYTLSPKCHPLLLDPQISTRDTALTNLYQAFLLAACKCDAHNRKFPKGHQAKDNPRFFAQLISDLPDYACKQASRRYLKLCQGEVTFPIGSPVVKWLCCRAFQVCLQRKQTRYKELLVFLKKVFKQFKGVLNEEEINMVHQSQNTVTEHLL